MHRSLELVGFFDFKKFNEGFDGDALDENSKINHCYCGCDEEWCLFDFVRIDEEDKSEGNGTTQTTIRHDEFIYATEFLQAEAIGYFRQNKNT